MSTAVLQCSGLTRALGEPRESHWLNSVLTHTDSVLREQPVKHDTLKLNLTLFSTWEHWLLKTLYLGVVHQVSWKLLVSCLWHLCGLKWVYLCFEVVWWMKRALQIMSIIIHQILCRLIWSIMEFLKSLEISCSFSVVSQNASVLYIYSSFYSFYYTFYYTFC